jgi:hypothetical protein
MKRKQRSQVETELGDLEIASASKPLPTRMCGAAICSSGEFGTAMLPRALGPISKDLAP